MEQNHTSGFDYGRVRDKMLKSWGRKPTEKEAPRREKTARKPENQKTSFKESKKAAKIEIRKEPSKPVKKPALPNPAQAQMGKSPRIHGNHPADTSISGMDTGTHLEDRHGETGFSMDPQKGIRQWAAYDAVFGPPRCKRPWRPFK